MRKFSNWLFNGKHNTLKQLVFVYLLLCVMRSIMSIVFHDTPVPLPFADSGDYYNHAKSFAKDGSFSLYNYPGTIRGYLFPFIIFLSQALGNAIGYEFLGWSAFNLAIYALIIVVMLPKLFEVKLSGRKAFIASMTFALLLFVFWRWVYLDLLSDGWGFFFALLSVLLLKAAHKERPFLYCLLSGMCAYAAYNTRTIYLFLFVAEIIAILIILLRERKSVALKISGLILFCIGFFIIGIPEALRNLHYLDKFSIFVSTKDLFGKQLFWGLTAERYDTLANEGIARGLFFYYPAGQLLAESSGLLNIDSVGVGDVVKLFLRHPLDMTVLYFRHFISLLTTHSPLVYIPDPKSRLMPLFVSGSYLYWFLGVLSFIRNKSERIRNHFNKSLFLAVIAISVLAILPGAIEFRFALPLVMLLYGYLCFVTDWRGVWNFIKAHKAAVVIICLLCYLVWITLFTSTLSSAGILLTN